MESTLIDEKGAISWPVKKKKKTETDQRSIKSFGLVSRPTIINPILSALFLTHPVSDVHSSRPSSRWDKFPAASLHCSHPPATSTISGVPRSSCGFPAPDHWSAAPRGKCTPAHSCRQRRSAGRCPLPIGSCRVRSRDLRGSRSLVARGWMRGVIPIRACPVGTRIDTWCMPEK